jgi:hypothetical protein
MMLYMKINMRFDHISLNILEWEMFRILLRIEVMGSYLSPFFFQRFKLDRTDFDTICSVLKFVE